MTPEPPIRAGSDVGILNEYQRWLAWKWEERTNPKTGEVKLTKPPYSRNGLPVSVKNPAGWMSRTEAASVPNMDGIGFSLFQHPNAVALDLDCCRERETGEIRNWARQIVEMAGSYTEITVSGRGLRVIGVVPEGTPEAQFIVAMDPADPAQKVEVYVHPARYITVSGEMWEELPTAHKSLNNVSFVLEHMKTLKLRAAREKNSGGTEAPAPDLTALPLWLRALIRDGVLKGGRSNALYKVVANLRRLGFTAEQISQIIRHHKTGIGAKCFESGKDDVERHVTLALRKIDDEIAKERAKGKGNPPPPEDAEEPTDHDPLITRAAVDSACVYEPEVLDQLRKLRVADRAAYERLLGSLKAQAKVSRIALDKAVRAKARRPRTTVEREPDWRERAKDGGPAPSMHNARLAIRAIGVECSFDTFHNVMLIGYRDDSFRHVLEPLAGAVSDDALLSLRRILSDRFGFDLLEKHMRDAVKSLALENCFDPVADMLAEAEAAWDGVERLDRMAVDYLNCEDTAFNRAAFRKFMVAAVARVRKPGCKFDTMPVLEAPEGYNKSTSLQVLAGEPENFSDEQIIGKDSRAVQENLATVWIHENADLAGMKKADVEMVKAFASRTTDRARPAYGHFLKEQPRHSVEVGTTNSVEYLQSQTGNRRFWPMKVLATIDLEKLKRDRLQLWGEAAHWQSHGESLVLDESLWPDADEAQEARRVKDPWEDVLVDIPETVDVPREHDRNQIDTVQIIHRAGNEEAVLSADLLACVLKVPPGIQDVRHSSRLPTVMERLGWRRAGEKITLSGRRGRGYIRPVDDDKVLL